MPTYDLNIRHLPAGDLVERLVASLAACGPSTNVASFSIDTNVGLRSPISGNPKIDDVAALPSVQQCVNELRAKPFIDVKVITFSSQDQFSLRYETDGIVGTFKISMGDNVQMPYRDQRMMSMTEALVGHFTILRRAEIIDQSLPARAQENLRYYERALSDMTAEVSKLGTVTADLLQRQQVILQEKIAEEDKRYKALEEELRRQHQAKLDDLESREREFKGKIEKFDLQERTAARRGLQKNLETLVANQKAIEITPKTLAERTRIHQLCIATLSIAGCILVGGIIFLMSRIYSDKPFTWATVSPLWLGSILFGSTLVFYLRWNNHWFNQLARTELTNRKFEADITRATWVIETLFETKQGKENQIDLPAEVIASLTRNLFSDLDAGTADLHPFDQIMSTIGKVTTVEVGKDQVKISSATEKK